MNLSLKFSFVDDWVTLPKTTNLLIAVMCKHFADCFLFCKNCMLVRIEILWPRFQ